MSPENEATLEKYRATMFTIRFDSGQPSGPRKFKLDDGALNDLLNAAREEELARVPEGWKLVPVTPTEAMVRIGANSVDNCSLGRTLEDDSRSVYGAMLYAAPAPPTNGGESRPKATDEEVEAEARRMRNWTLYPRIDSDWDKPGRIHEDAKNEWRQRARAKLEGESNG